MTNRKISADNQHIMNQNYIILIISIISFFIILWIAKNRKFETTDSVSDAYDTWTNDRILEKLWGEHILSLIHISEPTRPS